MFRGSETISGEKVGRTPVVGYYIAIAVDIVLLYVLNNIQYFGISILTQDYISCLWAVNLALSFGIVSNFILLLYRPRWFHHLVWMVLDALAIFAVYLIFTVFPFHFTADIFLSAARVILILIMAGIFIILMVELVRLVVVLSQKGPPSQPPVPPAPPVPPEPSR